MTNDAGDGSDMSTAARVTRLMSDLYPICRSIAGPGVRATLDRVASEIPIQRRSVASGERVLDWVVPDEWELREAHVTHVATGRRFIDTAVSNLHIVSHSVPFRARLTLDELAPHLFSLPDRPTWVPYRTSYYAPTWGFCLSDEVRASMPSGDYDVVVDTVLAPGRLEWGELVVPGETADEVLLTTHICHPSLANDNLSGIAALVELARWLRAQTSLRYTYRLLFIPGTIGSLSWLATTDDAARRVRHGLVLTGLGDPSGFTFKRTRHGDTELDRLMHVLLGHHEGAREVDFTPYGYDERQFCSPGFDLAVGRFTRGVHGEYPQYHTSADDLAFVSADQVVASIEVLRDALELLESNIAHRNLSPHGEPQLGRYGLYSSVGGAMTSKSVEMAYLWVLNQSDGRHDVIAIAERSGIHWRDITVAAQRLTDAGLLAPAGSTPDQAPER